MVLSERGLDRLLGLIGDAYGHDDLDSFRRALLGALGRAVPADYRSYNEVGVRADEIVGISDPPVDARLVEVWGRLAHQHPVIRYVRRTRDGRPWRISDHMHPAEFRRLELYRDFYRPLGVESQVALTLPSAAPLLIGIALSRGPRDFTDEEVEILARARPHLIQAYRDAQLSGARERLLEAIGRGLQEGGWMLAVVDRDGAVQFATPDAATALEVTARRGAPAGRLDRDLVERIDRRRARGAARGTPIVVERPGGPLLVRPMPGRTRAEPDVLLLERGDGGLSAARLAELGLTGRQAEALRWIALGRTVPEAARLMGVAPRTAAKHLQLAYARLGVSSRSEAAATAWAATGLPEPPAAPAAEGSPGRPTRPRSG
jgi:DNA-binding CsgD family transcriptional regulator